nr:ATP-binding cassette domain-containing protein [uncultured Vibrio sp.]
MVKSSWKKLSPFTFESLGLMCIVSAVVNALMLVVPVYSLQLFDRVLSSKSTDTLVLLSAIAVFLLFSQSLLDVLRQKFIQKKAMLFEAEASRSLYSHVSQSSGNANRYAFHDINEVRALLTSPSFFVAFDLPWTPIFIGVMFLLHPTIGMIGLVAVGVVLFVSLASLYIRRRSFDDAYIATIATSRKSDEIFVKRETLQSQKAETGLLLRFETALAEKLWFKDKVDQSSSSLTAVTKFVRMVLQITIMGMGALLVIRSEMSAGGMIAGSILMARALQPVEQLTSGFQGWKTGLSASKRLQIIFSDIEHLEERTQLPNIIGELKFEGIVWSPKEVTDSPILKNLTLRLEPGNRVAIIGHSGSGKSSLCKLIMGLNHPNKGRVLLDGLDVTHWHPEQFKQTVGYMPQHIQFINGTVKENIAHFDDTISDDQIVKAAIKAGVHDAILKLPNSYETRIGDGSFQLSGGQAQKLALARALCFNPKLLILDEPNSHMDKEGEEYLTSLLATCHDTQTSVVMITHQPHLLRHVDWVVELNNGQISRADEASKVLRSMLDVTPNERQSGASNG